MSIQDFKCEGTEDNPGCGEVREYIVKTDCAPVKCKACGVCGEFTRQVCATNGVRFKAGRGGFYATDYKTGGDKRDSLNKNQRSEIYGKE